MITYGLFLYIALTAAVIFISLGVETAGVGVQSRNVYLDRRTLRNRILAAGVFILLSAVSVCRIAVGNDYWVYRDNFNLIAQDRYVSYEPGFRYVVKFIQFFLDYDNYLPIFAFFSLVTVFLMVKAIYDQSDWFVYSIFLFMTAGYYFGSLNNVRYYLAMAAAMFSMKYVLTNMTMIINYYFFQHRHLLLLFYIILS